jgi:hypothetical protein
LPGQRNLNCPVSDLLRQVTANTEEIFMATNPGTELATLDFGNLIGGPLVAVITAQSVAARSTADFIKTVGFYPAGQKDANGIDIGGTPVYVDFKYPKETQPYQPGKTFYKIGSINIDDGGSGYTSAPTVTSSAPGTGETAAVLGTVTVSNGAVSGIPVTSGGVYLTPPTLTMSPPAAATGTPAKASVAMVVDHVDSAVLAVYQDMKFSVPILTMLPVPFIKIDIATIDFNAKISSVETASQSSDLAISGSLEVQQRWPSGAAKLNVSCAYKKSTESGSSVERTYSMAVHVEASQDEMPAGMKKLLNLLESAMISTPA